MGRFWMVVLTLAVLLVVAGVPARADTVRAIEVYNTGVDNNGDLLSEFDLDPHWLTLAVPPFRQFGGPGPAFVTEPHQRWIGTVSYPDSMWINPSGQAQTGEPGTIPSTPFLYGTYFDLTGLVPATAKLIFQIAVDNILYDVELNGVRMGIGLGDPPYRYESFSDPITIDEGFVDGLNEIRFHTGNLGNGSHGFRLEFLEATATAIPLPASASLGLLLLGALGVARVVRRRRRAA